MNVAAPPRSARLASRPDQVDAGPLGRRRWLALAFIALAQLMIALDATVLNIALPSAQQVPGFADADRQWLISAYTLAFGGLVLLGGALVAALLGGDRAQ